MKDTLHSAKLLFSAGFGAGYWPWGPGTMGSLLAVLIWWLMAYSIESYAVVQLLTMLLTVLFTVLSIPAVGCAEAEWGHDSPRVVVDEMVGMWVALCAVPATRDWWWPLAALILFRLFDIYKPLGCRWIDRNIPGVWGVMLDDILAGVYAALVLAVLTLI